MINLVMVGIGGAAGAIARYLTGVAYMRAAGPGQPYLATLICNVVGGLLMGVLIGVLTKTGASDRVRLLLAVGVLGGYTTFSSFSLEAVMMLERRAYGTFAAYVAGSVTLSVLALILGLVVMRKVAL
ncbi:MAG: fluoride efflux transporter CrcB [Caulobacteraceae bacterium]